METRTREKDAGGERKRSMETKEARTKTFEQSTLTFGVLAVAFAVSILYQLYRATLMEIPEYDAFTLTTGIGYALCIGVCALVLTDRLWAWWIVSALVLFLVAIGLFYYFPVVTTARDMGFVDWLEGLVFVGLLFVAGFVCALRLLGVSLALEPSTSRVE